MPDLIALPIAPPHAGGARRASVFIVDDQPIARSGMAVHINAQPDMAVVGHAEAYAEALSKIVQARPDVAIVDIALAGVSGIDLLKALRRRAPATRTLVFTAHDEGLYAERALRAGAAGYVSKAAPPRQLLGAIRRVLDGRFAVGDGVVSRLITRIAATNKRGGADLDSLSDRELEVFNRLGRGRTTGEIAAELCVSVKTVGSHKARIKRKLGLKTTAELVRAAAATKGGF